jgi:hypothetical protein
LGDVTLWYQISGSLQILFVTDLGENEEFREKYPNMWEKYEFE